MAQSPSPLKRDPNADKLQLYQFLSRIKPLSNSYIAKMMSVIVLCSYVPLLVLVISFIFANFLAGQTALKVLGISIVGTLIGSGITLVALRQLLSPILISVTALKNYLYQQTLPILPTKFRDEAGTLMENITKTVHRLDQLILQVTYFNYITGLPNRTFLLRKLKELIEARLTQGIVLYLIAVEDFEVIINTIDFNDILQKTIAQRLSLELKPIDTLSQIGNREFVLMSQELQKLDTISGVVARILDALSQVYRVGEEEINLSFNVGIVVKRFTEDTTPEQILQEAHSALYQAQKQGRNCYQFYSPDLNFQLRERLQIETGLYEALSQNQLRVFYQPVVNLKTQKVTAVEALLRWQHPTLGMVPPVKFIPVAEESGLILPIGEWVLRTACHDHHAWQKLGIPPLKVAVNLSGRQFETDDLMDKINRILEETGMDPQYLKLEVTESFLMRDIQRSVGVLSALRQRGIDLALDDFGTGYSSLSYLKKLPINYLKIDRSFVTDLETNPESTVVTDAIIALGKSLSLTITAEGIETQAQLDYLLERGCDEGQGYFFSPPLPTTDLVDYLYLHCSWGSQLQP
ncbi:MAG: EAL domain-containing protein [Thermostichales cyanobacterium DRC_bins_46]